METKNIFLFLRKLKFWNLNQLTGKGDNWTVQNVKGIFVYGTPAFGEDYWTRGR
jgi:hypothetical protein